MANSTSHGTRRAKKVGGVASRIAPPTAPPARLMTNSAFSDRPSAPCAPARPVKPVTIWAGNSATVEVMLAARASMPVNISDGRVMNEPPPASAFCPPAHSDATNNTINAAMLAP